MLITTFQTSSKKDGSLASKQNRLGPLHIEARLQILEQVLRIQDEVNIVARAEGKSEISLINDEELARIQALIAANTYPERWDGTEPKGDILLPTLFSDGAVQPLLFDDSAIFG